MNSASWSIAGGGGHVGSALVAMIKKSRVAADFGLNPYPDHVLGRDGWHIGSRQGPVAEARSDVLPDSDVLFVTMPSTSDNQPMLSLIRQQLIKGRTVITAEKATVADHYREFMELPGKLGLWATVGGGTRMIDKLKLDSVDPGNIRELYKCTNATLNYLLSSIAAGKDREEVVAAADEAHYIEPGATHLYDICLGEAVDAARKEVLSLKMTLPGFETLKLADVQTELSKEQVEQVLSKPDKYRYLTANLPESSEKLAKQIAGNRLGGFELRRPGFLIVGGFLQLDQTEGLRRFREIPGARTGYYISFGPSEGGDGDGSNFVEGSGAGANVTANAMLDNYKTLMRKD